MANITSIADVVNISQNVGGNVTIPFVQGSEALAYDTIMSNNGFSVIEGGLNTKAVEVVGSSGLNVVGNQAVETVVETVGEATNINITPFPATQTSTGVNILEGALAMEVSPMMVTQGVLAGMGLGWELYKANPYFWTTISDSLIGWKSLSPNSDTEIPYLKAQNGVEVLLRLTDAGLKMYLDKAKADNLIQTLYEQGALVTNAHFVPDVTETGVYPLTTSGCDFDSFLSAIPTPKPSDSVYQVEKANFNDYVTSHGFNAMVISYYLSLWEGGGFVNIDVDAYKLENERNVQFIVEGDKITLGVDALQGLDGAHYVLQYNYYGGGHRQSGWTSTPTRSRVIYNPNSSPYIFSSFNSHEVLPRPEIIPNPDETHINTPAEFPEAYPLWVGNGFSSTQYNPDTNENDLIDWLPLSIPSDWEVENPQYKPTQAQAQEGVVPENDIDPNKLPDWLKDIIDRGADGLPPENDTPEIPTGSTPIVVPPTGLVTGSNKLYTVYRPTDTDLDNLGAYLWSNNVIQRLVELFTNNPMDAIISLHQVYVTPLTGESKYIVLGDVVTNVSSLVVTNQYMKINCGSMKLLEKYGDARDYDYTKVEAYLPFIGFREIDVHDVINCTVNIVYTVDVYTGTCLCEIIVTKNNVTQTLYTFEGNCSVQIPLTASDRTRMISAFASATIGYAVGGVSGMMASALRTGAQAPIQKSSGFTGNVGAMACKKPYLVITRNKSAYAEIQPQIEGRPTNRSVYLKDCKGYVRVKGIHLDSLRCTDREKDMLMSILKNGIII